MKRKPFTKGLTSCWRGHAFTPENTIIREDGTRNCKTCRRDYMRVYMRGWLAKRKALRAA